MARLVGRLAAAGGRAVAGARRRPPGEEHVGRTPACLLRHVGGGAVIASSTVSSSPARRSSCWIMRTSPTGRDEADPRLDEDLNVHSTLNCSAGGAMVAIYHFHGVPKHTLEEKAFGVYRHHNRKPSSVYLNGFSDNFEVPVSRWTEIRIEDNPAVPSSTSCLIPTRRVSAPCGSRLETVSTSSTMWNMIPPRSPTNISAMSRPVCRIKLPKNYFAQRSVVAAAESLARPCTSALRQLDQ